MIVRLFLGGALLSLILGCGTKQPVLYPDQHLAAVGNQAAQQDVEDCFRRAEEAEVRGDLAVELAQRTGKTAVVGGAAGAVAGAISGSVGQGSLIGAATGGTIALVSGLFEASDPDPLVMRFVEQCLFEKGYQVLGWR
jgi:predicted small lipoprotein YifL